MTKFNLDEYEPVKVRKSKFKKDYPDGRIIVEVQNNDESLLDYTLFKATLYKNAEEQERNLPWATGYALELRDKKLSVSSSGKEYESVNYSSWTENAEESAVGRALDNAGYAGAPSREEMMKVERHSEIQKKAVREPSVPNKPIEGTMFGNDPKLRDTKGHTYCIDCGKVVSRKVEKYSADKFGKVLCMTCQQKQ